MFDIPRCLRRWLLEVFSIKSIQKVSITTPISTCSVRVYHGTLGMLCLVFGMSKTREFHISDRPHAICAHPSGWRDVIACVADRAAWLLVKV